ncbi:GntR family transcriptional regulator [Verminephrobacter aporrectodeae subsp. tuberculatae]|uniref:GntR family transcriptional regulator n=1 Tax=Verminephrobacter aporrectodeae subsp. tuberculatae TaxID=1110392 RepID=A0ABT3KRN3_9BURK|nr:GntR family transcriptional regulator [Verminephrobacter aporrectodeae]MCW5220131.1 GntR family transcriptional regulator [Verminephrobacter aporrectodeae subsp. tuberculatae]MCW5289419.1 GntR family transcriptional regulator [Verminephrobacter aporrectodeae subsp. tuberculatae]MCW5320920.1 GntR family transcriptional regulator [Verminephrobacter aporrectodeae subsp. tuberculatae]MCW8198825.1 GntR family transcriptional regulator [Verminephrobacter aporrectodeae subsp. tuberculatae]MCW82086
MPRTAHPRPRLVEVSAARPEPPPADAGRTPRNLYARAHEAIEACLVTCELQPGRHLATQELRDLVQLGRTPVHQAVTRLAEDTLLRVHPRRGLQVAPIDLARERALLRLRRDMERFVIRLAAEKSGSSHRNQMLHIKRHLRENQAGMTIDAFNVIDRRLDRLFLAAAGEPFVENTLRPLHTIFRRIGWLYHSKVASGSSVTKTVDVHLALIDAVANCHVEQALRASDELIGFVDSMFDVLEREIDPVLLDCSLGDFDGL